MKTKTLIIISILLFSTITMNEVKSVTEVEIINGKTQSGSWGYMEGSVSKFEYELRNNTTESKTVTTRVYIHSAFHTYIDRTSTDTLVANEVLSKKGYDFDISEVGEIYIEVTSTYDSETYIIVGYKFYKQSFTTNEDKFYAGQELIATLQMVNKGDSRSFKIKLELKTPQNTIRQTETKTETVPSDGILECELHYMFLPKDSIGQWSIEMEIAPELHPNLQLPIEKYSISFSEPTFNVEIEAPSYFTIGEDARFSFTLKNESDISMYFPEVYFHVENVVEKPMIIEQVRCWINDELSNYVPYPVTLLPEGNIGSEVKYDAKINLDASLENEYTKEEWWKAGEYKIIITVKTSMGSFLSYYRAVELRSVTPLIEPSLMIDQPIYVIRGRTEPITVYFQFENLTKIEQDIGTVYLYVEPPAGDVTVKPEKIQNIYLSKRRVSGCIYYDQCDFHPTKTKEGSIISGIYKLYFYLDAELEVQLTDPLEIRIEEKEYSRKLNLSVSGIENTYAQGSMISANVIVANAGVQREDYTLYVEIRKPMGDIERKILLSAPQVSIDPEMSQDKVYNIPTKDMQGYISLGYKTMNFYIKYSVEGEERREEVPFDIEITAQKGLNFAKYDINYKVSPRSVVKGQMVTVEVSIANNDDRTSFFEVVVDSDLFPDHDKQTRNIYGLTDATDKNPNTYTFSFTFQAVNEALDSRIRVTVNGQALPDDMFVTIRETPSPTATPPPSGTSKMDMFMYIFIICAIIVLFIFIVLKSRKKRKKKKSQRDIKR